MRSPVELLLPNTSGLLHNIRAVETSEQLCGGFHQAQEAPSAVAGGKILPVETAMAGS